MHFLQKPSPALASTQWSFSEDLIMWLKYFFIKRLPMVTWIFEHLSFQESSCNFLNFLTFFWWFSQMKCDFDSLNLVLFFLHKIPDSISVGLLLQFPNGIINFRSLWSKPLRKMSLSQFASKKRRRVTWVLHPFLHYFFFLLHTYNMHARVNFKKNSSYWSERI